ncbi:MAG: amidohydrolase family protein [Planctomycetes bacterium]|nr:amidohydrolase family protein [Planctomycetota bacterium]
MRFLNMRLALALGLSVSIPVHIAWSQEADPTQKGEEVATPAEGSDQETETPEQGEKGDDAEKPEAKEEEKAKDEAKEEEEKPAPSLTLPEEVGALLFIEAERLIVRPGKELAGGKVIVRNGRIQSVGEDLVAPEGARTLKGKVVCAGFIDPWSTLAIDTGSLYENRADAASQTLDALELFGPKHAHERALAAGVLAFETHVGARASIGGTGVILRTQPSTQAEDILISDRSAMWSAVGLQSDVISRIEEVDGLINKLLAGEAYLKSWRDYEKEVAEWEKEIAELQEKLEKDFKKAQKDREKKVEKAKEEGKKFKDKRHKEPKPPRKPKVDADKAALGRVMTGEVPLIVRAEHAAVLRNLLDATEELRSLRLVIAGGKNAMHVAPRLAERNIPVIVWPAEALGESNSAEGTGLDLAGDLARSGVTVLIGSGLAGDTSALPLYASLAVGHGLDSDQALAAITTEVAEAFDLQDELGSVRRGRRAELLILNGDPLSMGTQVQYVVSGGEVVVEPKE